MPASPSKPTTVSVWDLAGVAVGVLAASTTVRIPTLALLLGLGAVALGLARRRHSAGLRRALAVLTMVLGVGAISAVVAIVVFGSGPSSGSFVTN